MKTKIISVIRKLLQGIILPIRRKKETFLSNIRLSIAFRIAMAYMKLLITHGTLLLAGFFLLYMLSEKSRYDGMAEDIISSIKEDLGTDLINPYYMQGISLIIVNQMDGTEIYNDISYLPSSERTFFHEIHFDRNDGQDMLIVDEVMEYMMNGVPYRIDFQYDLTASYQNFLALLWKLILLYLIIVALIIKKGIRTEDKLLEPIRTMSATANRLTVNNLHSERLNEEGIKNELKDLASVINAMLDRIETSYESQKQFVSDASHELRTPIAVIQGYSNLLDRWGSTNEEVLQESIEAIQNESRSMQDLVEKLLYLSRHDKKTFKLSKKKFNMKNVVADMVKETKLVATNRIISNPIMEDIVVYGDKQALKQALRVFIDNAVKYSADGDEITIHCQNVNGDCVITVQDTGIGMNKKDLEHIFDRFYRSDHVRNKNISGHGLGLSLAKLIILSHTGKIKVRSQYKKGTSFIITIPKRRF